MTINQIILILLSFMFINYSFIELIDKPFKGWKKLIKLLLIIGGFCSMGVLSTLIIEIINK